MTSSHEGTPEAGTNYSFFDPLEPGYQLVSEVQRVCDYDYYDTGDPKRAAGCGGIYYRRISISPSSLVHNERTHCKCSQEWLDINRDKEEREKRQREVALLNKKITQLFGPWNLLNDEVHAHMSLKSYHVENESQHQAMRYLMTYEYCPEGICLYGYPGRGKTHLAIGLARKLRSEGCTVLAIKSIDLLNRIKKTYDKRDDAEEIEIMNTLKRVDVLVIDDIGQEKGTEWVQAKFYEVIDTRHKRRPTIFTTNLGEEEMEKKLNGGLVSRIMGVGKSFYIKGEDRRTNPGLDIWSDVGREVAR